MATLRGKEARELLTTHCPGWDCLEEGKTVCVAHSCETGHKQRLYITNKGGMWVFYCHNCSDQGIYIDRDSYSPLQTPEHTALELRDDSLSKALGDIKYGWGTLTPEIRLWLSTYYVDEEMYNRNRLHFGVQPDTSRCAILGYSDGLCTHMQLRSFNKYYDKYKTFVHKENRNKGVLFSKTPGPFKTLFITEDMLSAYRIMDAGGAAFALMGTKKRSNMPKADRCLIWLDPDAAGMEGALQLTREITPLYNECRVLAYSQEPKHYTPSHLEKLIRYT